MGRIHSDVGFGGRCRGHGESCSPNKQRCESCPAGNATCPERFRPQTAKRVRNPEGGSRLAARGGGESSTLLRKGDWVGSESTDAGRKHQRERIFKRGHSRANEQEPYRQRREAVQALWKASRWRVEEDAKSMRGASLLSSNTTDRASRSPLKSSRQRPRA